MTADESKDTTEMSSNGSLNQDTIVSTDLAKDFLNTPVFSLAMMLKHLPSLKEAIVKELIGDMSKEQKQSLLS